MYNRTCTLSAIHDTQAISRDTTDPVPMLGDFTREDYIDYKLLTMVITAVITFAIAAIVTPWAFIGSAAMIIIIGIYIHIYVLYETQIPQTPESTAYELDTSMEPPIPSVGSFIIVDIHEDNTIAHI